MRAIESSSIVRFWWIRRRRGDTGPNYARDCAAAVKPALKLGPHVAPLAVRFYTGKQFPAAYQNQAFIAQHGSWNRSTPIGYRIMLVKLNGDQVAGYEEFATGWLKPDGQVSGRPVDLKLLPDGSMQVSDDQEGAIYRISYKK